MPKLLLPLAGMVLMATAALVATQPAEANSALATTSSIRATIGNTTAVEQVACFRRRVCGPRGCVWRTWCRGRRW
jgi:hypothetical protein